MAGQTLDKWGRTKAEQKRGFAKWKRDAEAVIREEERASGYRSTERRDALKKAVAKNYAKPAIRKDAAGPRSSPVLKSSVAASKKGTKLKSSAAKKAATRKRLTKGSGPKSNLRVKSAAYYARKRAAAKKKK